MNLWLDDVRPPPQGEDWTWVKTFEEAVKLLETGEVEYASLDHDLGDDMEFVREDDDMIYYKYNGWSLGDPCPSCGSTELPKFNGGDPFFTCCDKTVDEIHFARMRNVKTGYDVVKWMTRNDIWPKDGIRVHSWNYPGADRMCKDIDRFGPYESRCIHTPDTRQHMRQDERDY